MSDALNASVTVLASTTAAMLPARRPALEDHLGAAPGRTGNVREMARARSTASAWLPLQWPLVGRHEQVELFAATLADPRAHGFVIHGDRGVGKTRLADECLAIASRAGRDVVRATATEGSRATPLGALAHLLPPGIGAARADLVAVMAEVRPLLQDRPYGPLVMFIDDLHLLDASSATLVGQLVDADLAFLVATVRTDAELPAGVESLWQRARVRRVDLGDLAQSDIDTLLQMVLRGPVEATTSGELWQASRGNVLFVRELVLGALDGGRLARRRDVWRLSGPLVTTPRLGELVIARLGGLQERASGALEVLAVWEPAGLADVESAVGRDQLDALDRAGLLEVRVDARRHVVTLAHPLYGEIVRERMPALRRRRLLLEHADRIEAHGARRREDAIRIATARLDAGGVADGALLLRGARLARYGHDFAQVERLAAAAIGVDGLTPEAGLLLGEALHERGRFAEADDVLTGAQARAVAGDDLLVHLVEIRSRNLMWGLLRADDALEVNRRARELVGEDRRLELDLNEALLLSYGGRPAEALACLERAGPAALAGPRLRALHALAEVPALVAAGRCATAAERADAAFAEHAGLPDQLALPTAGTHVVNQIYALTECGRLHEAEVLAEAAYAATPSSAPPDVLMWLSHQQGRVALARGRPDTARRWMREALGRCEEANLVGPRRLVLSALATASAWLGDGATAADCEMELAGLPPFDFAHGEQEVGRAWAMVADGDLPGARAILSNAADRAAATGQHMAEATLLHEVARLGGAEDVAARLATTAARCEGELAAACASHASALASGSVDGLLSAADSFAALGAMLLAAEAATEAGHTLYDAGERRAASAAFARAGQLAEACEGARTPALTAPVAVAPLTARERDIATLAARGESSKEIADRLVLSVRTVNNHLQSVYSKLGVTSRRDLATALAAGDEPST
jgi:DNA-binding NarL/FixJ family response regulator